MRHNFIQLFITCGNFFPFRILFIVAWNYVRDYQQETFSAGKEFYSGEGRKGIFCQQIKNFFSSSCVNDVLLKRSQNFLKQRQIKRYEIWIWIFINFQQAELLEAESRRTLSKWAKPIMRVSLLSLVRYKNTLNDVYSDVCGRAYKHMWWFNTKDSKIMRKSFHN